MGFALELCFDEKSENEILKLSQAIIEKGISNKFLEMNSKPHLALSVYDEVNEEQVKKLIDRFLIKPITIDLQSIGTFAGSENVIFLTPKVTVDLLKIHELYHKHFNEIKSGWEYYSQKNWFPHCTIAINIEENKFLDAFDIIKKRFNPLKVIIKKIIFIKFRPVSVLYEKEFN
jgi:2'-5' RNA ligase